MFVGHWAPALAAAAATPRAPRLAVLFLAAQLIDWAFFALLLTGAEQMRFAPGISAMSPMDPYHLPYTHSLLGAGAFSAVFALGLLALGYQTGGALIGGMVVLSHWFLDLLVHVPDLTLDGSPPKLGLGLWNWPWIAIPLELGITFGALWWYQRTRRPAWIRTAMLGAVLIILQAYSWFGPVAPRVTTGTSLLAFAAFGLVTAMAWWTGKSEGQTAQPL